MILYSNTDIDRKKKGLLQSNKQFATNPGEGNFDLLLLGWEWLTNLQGTSTSGISPGGLE